MFDSYVIQSRLNRILDLLTQERRLILAGSFDALEELTLRRAAAMEALALADDNTLARHAPLIRRISKGADRNRRLIEACLKGAAAADFRLKEISTSRTQLSVYTPSGKRLTSPAGQSGQDRRS